ncbi:MAG TPA: WD40 repeat domain-containing protein [Trebonia sp.]
MAPGTHALSPVLTVGGDGTSAARRSALIISAAAYADTQLAWLRPPVSGTAELAAALADPQVGGFGVDTLANGTETETRLAIARFLAGRTAGETVVLYLSCHAIRDHAQLYFAAADTWLRYPQRSAVPAASVLDQLERCGAGNRLLILDCCFVGGFAEERGDIDLATELALEGRGIAVLSGSRVREYSYEGLPIGPELPRSLFTEGLAAGLAAGSADDDGDGWVTVAEAYGHAYRYVSQYTPRQAPQYHLDSGQGEIVLGHVPGRGGEPGRPGANPPGTGGARPRLPMPWRVFPGPGGSASLPALGLPGAGPRREDRDGARRDSTRRAAGAHESAPARVAEAASATAGAREGAPAGAIVEQDKDNAYCVAFSPDSLLLASGGWNRPVRMRDTAAGSLARELKSAGSAYDLAFSPDGTLIATGGRDGTVALHDLSGKRPRARKANASPVRAVAFSPDGTLLVSGHEDGVARFWDVPTLGRRLELRAEGETVYGAAFSPDARLVAAACADGAVRLWRLFAADEPPAVLPCHTGWATGVTFSPDGRRLASAGADGLVVMHDTLTREQTGVLRAGDGIVNAIAISPDGSFLAAARETGAVTVWELATGRAETMPGHAGHVNDVAFSPDGRLLASAGKDGTVRLWR